MTSQVIETEFTERQTSHAIDFGQQFQGML